MPPKHVFTVDRYLLYIIAELENHRHLSYDSFPSLLFQKRKIMGHSQR